MDFLTLGKILFRRWYVTLPMVLLTVVVAAAVVRSVEPEYEASGSFVLLGPREHLPPFNADPGTAPLPRNPYTEFTPSLTTAAGTLELVLEDGQVRNRLRQLRLSDDIEVTADDEAPTLEVTVGARRAGVAVETIETIFSMMGDELRQRQDDAGAPENLQITVEALVLPETARELTAARDRALVAFSVLGVVSTVGLAVIVDSIATARRARRSRRGGLDGLGDVEWMNVPNRALEDELSVPSEPGDWLDAPAPSGSSARHPGAD